MLGYKVKVLDLPLANWEETRSVEGIDAILGDVNDSYIIYKASKNVDIVSHLVALLPPRSESDKKITMKVNEEGTRNIQRAIREKKQVPVNFSSSISTYGITASKELPISEDHPQKAHNSYSKSKIEAEWIIRASEIPHVVLRIAPIAFADLVELPDIVPYNARASMLGLPPWELWLS